MTDSPQSILVTVALCTHNHAERLQRTLLDLGKLIAPNRPWECLIVDNASSDDTSRILAELEWRPAGVPVRVVREMQLGLANARNRAIREAQGVYIVFLDDDETPDPHWLAAFEGAILVHMPEALGGRIKVLFEHGKRPDWLLEELLGFLGELDHGEARWLTEPNTPFYGGNFAVRREVFETIGTFDAKLGRKGRMNAGGEDTDFYRRLIANGKMVRWVPEGIIYHRIRADKLRRTYFLELHYRQGRIEGATKRGESSRVPPKYLFPQLGRAVGRALGQRWKHGGDSSLRLEMNVAYFLGYILGWLFVEKA